MTIKRKDGLPSRIGRHVLAALTADKGWVSSTGMIGALDVSRMTISTGVRGLRELGYGIETSPRLGYRLTTRTDRPVPEEVEPLLRTRVVGRAYRYFTTLDSTNAFLRARLHELPEGTAVIADSQTQGRGRLQRSWFSPRGVNLYLSVLLKPAVSPFLAPELSLVAAASVLRAVHALGCKDAQVKWPNDVLWHGKKLAGILCELEAETDVIHGVVIGIGVNVNVDVFPAALRRTATSLRKALGRRVPRPTLAAQILNNLDADYAAWLRDGLSGISGFLNEHSYLAGREVTVILPREAVRGRVERITETGLLRLVQADGTAREIASGEVQLCRPAQSRKTRSQS